MQLRFNNSSHHLGLFSSAVSVRQSGCYVGALTNDVGRVVLRTQRPRQFLPFLPRSGEWGAPKHAFGEFSTTRGGNKSLGRGTRMMTGFVITTELTSLLIHTSCLGSSAPLPRRASCQNPPRPPLTFWGPSFLLLQEPTGPQTIEGAPKQPPVPSQSSRPS